MAWLGLLCIFLLPAGATAGEQESRDDRSQDDRGEPAAIDPLEPPPGSAEDVALYRLANEVSEQILVERSAANKLQWEAIQRRYDARLDAAAKQPEPAAGASQLLDHFRKALAHNLVTVTRTWPIDPTRGCRYPAMMLDATLRAPASPRRATQLQLVREDVQECLDRVRPALRIMADSNREVRRLFAELDKLLPPLTPAARAAARPEALPAAAPVQVPVHAGKD